MSSPKHVAKILIQQENGSGNLEEAFIRIPANQIDGLTTFIQNTTIQAEKIIELNALISSVVAQGIQLEANKVVGLTDFIQNTPLYTSQVLGLDEALEAGKTEWTIVK